MKNKINRMFKNDMILIYVYIALMWTILTVVRNNIKLITNDLSVLMFMNVVWALVLVFGTTALMVVFIHLKKQKERIYSEDIKNGEAFK
ncbi:hypothetical protein SAMN02745751_02829 [Dethiosulfatibacter aminovorans DSM 17477]|uniref:Uncharacterized protein n=1 Tax=Dethiosulfatibacter aminovorans DSM 17477 TaxID=1121476 RepID=A0A1M6K9A1_9FIRM|nr:hypothetical protein [Dethiosulfatibacter aminovorans]SHJ55493.1 hypothetical protein SAMN02745751_02829 [Dethiosulfatibacter aminovorans DSM 17477]